MEAKDYFQRGVEQLQSGQYQEAINDFSEAIREAPEVAVAWRYRAKAHLALGNYLRAINDLNETIRINPEDIQAYYDRGETFLRQHRYDDALQDCEKGLQLDPGRFDFIGLRSQIHSARGDTESALLDLAMVIQQDPDQLPDYLIRRGDIYMDCEEYERAIADYNRVIELAPEIPYPYVQRGNAHWLLEQRDLALENYTLAIEKDANWFWPYFRRACLLRFIDRWEEALADFEKSIQLDPTFLGNYEFRCELYRDMGRMDEAMKDLDQALTLAPKGPKGIKFLNLRAMWNYFDEQYQKAIRAHVEALKLDPDHAPTLNYLAWIWCTAPDATVRNGKRALDCATRACELTDFQNAGFLDTLAAAYAEMGEFDEAITTEEKAIDLAEDENSREEYLGRVEQYRNHEPLRVYPHDGV